MTSKTEELGLSRGLYRLEGATKEIGFTRVVENKLHTLEDLGDRSVASKTGDAHILRSPFCFKKFLTDNWFAKVP